MGLRFMRYRHEESAATIYDVTNVSASLSRSTLSLRWSCPHFKTAAAASCHSSLLFLLSLPLYNVASTASTASTWLSLLQLPPLTQAFSSGSKRPYNTPRHPPNSWAASGAAPRARTKFLQKPLWHRPDAFRATATSIHRSTRIPHAPRGPTSPHAHLTTGIWPPIAQHVAKKSRHPPRTPHAQTGADARAACTRPQLHVRASGSPRERDGCATQCEHATGGARKPRVDAATAQVGQEEGACKPLHPSVAVSGNEL
ncbi:hypothetical protein C8R43DRAFT_193101 [Mycena crocata]|nr:hypothetical protein C8R43DRAFT_193101 [Mycena crocata]